MSLAFSSPGCLHAYGRPNSWDSVGGLEAEQVYHRAETRSMANYA